MWGSATMDTLEKNNPHERDSHITFTEEGHKYTIDGDSDYLSVTTWNHSHFPHFDPDRVIKKMKAGRNWENSQYYGMESEAIKKLWKDRGREASKAGTEMHYDIERFYNGQPVANDSKEFSDFLKFDAGRGDLIPYRTEWMIYDKELRFAGSIDMVFENPDGTLQLYDWKRSKEIKRTNRWECGLTECVSHVPNSNYWLYSLQLNTYKAILERNYGKRVTDMYLVCFHPTRDTFERIRVPALPAEIDALFRLRAGRLSADKGLES